MIRRMLASSLPLPLAYLYCYDTSSVACDESSLPGSLYVFGSNTAGQLSTATSRDTFLPSRSSLVPAGSVKLLSCSDQNTACALKSGLLVQSGKSLCGSGFINEYTFDNIKELSLGYRHGALIDGQGDVYTWGSNLTSQLGRPTEDWRGSDTPEKIQVPAVKFTKVSCGGNFSVGLSDDGSVYTWGSGRDGSLGSGSTGTVHSPLRLDPLLFDGNEIVDVACGRESTVVLTKSGILFSFGCSDFGKLGIGKVADRIVHTPTRISGVSNVVMIASGDYHASAVTREGRVFTWGKGNSGCLGVGSTQDAWAPVEVSELASKGVVRVFCGGSHSGALTSSGKLYLWGKGRSGQLGQGSDIASVAAYRTTPVLFESHNVELACLGGDHTVIVVEK